MLEERATKGEIETKNTAIEKSIAEDWLPALLEKIKKGRSKS